MQDLEKIKTNAHNLFSFEQGILNAYPETRVFYIVPKGVIGVYNDLSTPKKSHSKRYAKFRNALQHFKPFCKAYICISLPNGDYRKAKVINL